VRLREPQQQRSDGSRAGSKRLSALLAQLTRLQGIRFKHLSDVYGFDFDAETGVLEVLIEPLGGSLQDVLFVAQRLPTDRIATIALQVAEGLAALHDAGLLHKCLSPERVHLLSRDPSSLKLSSACYMQDLLDINRSTPFAASRPFPSLPDAWRCPEAVLEPLAYTQARDVWDFGLLVVALHGADTFDVYQEPTAFAESSKRDDFPPCC
jgi:serine/threonine protein kinase